MPLLRLKISGGMFEMGRIAIVGAGPTGATLAYLLAERGIEVTLIEAARFGRVFRGEGLMPGGLQALDQMGLIKLLQQIPTRQIHAWEFVVDNCTVLRANEPDSLGLYRPTLIPQPAFLEAVVAKAATCPNFQFVRGQVHDLLWREGRVCGVRVKQVEQQGDQQPVTQIEADLVIGADGRSSAIRRLANLAFTPLDYDADLQWFRLPAPLPADYQTIFYGFIRGSKSFGAYTSWDDSLKLAYILPQGQSPTAQPNQLNWAEHLAAIAPDWFAAHLRRHAEALEPPLPLKVVFGRCPRWYEQGLLLLGDAAHPMAPIRAQGINVAFRDVIVAANHLVPLLAKTQVSPSCLDQALAAIQAEREPEIMRAQQLQRQEQGQANLLCRFTPLRRALTLVAPILRPAIAHRWMARQHDLRFGVSPLQLRV
jgi:2-polyprenyl-6-methoxyphenol hydroxylase-like FAD-dependent oxidoreductase